MSLQVPHLHCIIQAIHRYDYGSVSIHADTPTMEDDCGGVIGKGCILSKASNHQSAPFAYAWTFWLSVQWQLRPYELER